MNLLWISEGPTLDHRPERFKRRFVTRNRPPALQFHRAAGLDSLHDGRMLHNLTSVSFECCRTQRLSAMLSSLSKDNGIFRFVRMLMLMPVSVTASAPVPVAVRGEIADVAVL